MQVYQEDITVTAGGFFNIDNSMIFSVSVFICMTLANIMRTFRLQIVSAFGSYFIISIQFINSYAESVGQ